MTLDRTAWEPAYYDDRLEYVTLAGSIKGGDDGNLDVTDNGVTAIMLGEIPSWQTVGLVFRVQWPESDQAPIRLGIGLAGPHSRLPLPATEVGDAGELTGLPGVRSLQFAVNIPFEFTAPGTHHLCLYFDGQIAATIEFDVSSIAVPNTVTFGN